MSAAHDREAHDLAGEIGPLIAQSRRVIWLAAAKRLEEEGEAILVWQALNQLTRLGPSTQRTLADALAQHPAGMSRLLDDLEQRGLVTRTRDVTDRRCVTVALTARGRAHRKHLLPYVAEVVHNAIVPLSLDERRTLRDLLRKIVGPTPVLAISERPTSRAKKRR
jgi:DNA-binding MarR family transcriptional regulator